MKNTEEGGGGGAGELPFIPLLLGASREGPRRKEVKPSSSHLSPVLKGLLCFPSCSRSPPAQLGGLQELNRLWFPTVTRSKSPRLLFSSDGSD